MNQQQLILTNKEAQQKLEPIFNDIADELLREDEDILNELIPIIKKLDDQDRSALFEYFKLAFPDQIFWKTEEMKVLEQSDVTEKINYIDLYNKEKQEKNWANFINLLKIKEFCQQNKIPEILFNKESLAIMQKQQEKMFNLFELNELMLTQKQNPQHFIDCLLQIIFNENEISEIEQNQFEQIVGNLLITKIYEFLDFKDSIFQENMEQAMIITDAIQNFQLKHLTLDEILKGLKGKQYQFVNLLCNQYLKNPKLNLQNYFYDLLKIKERREIKLITLKKQISIKVQQLTLKDIACYEECYFRILFYFWIQYFNKLNQLTEIKVLEDDLKKAKPERRSAVINRFISKIKKLSNDQLHLFIVENLIFFSPDTSSWIDMEKYERHKNLTNKYLAEAQAQQYQCASRFFQTTFDTIIKGFQLIKNLSLTKLQLFFTQNQDYLLYYFLYFTHERNAEKILLKLSQIFLEAPQDIQTSFQHIEQFTQILQTNEMIILINLMEKYCSNKNKIVIAHYRVSLYIFQNFSFAKKLQFMNRQNERCFLIKPTTIENLLDFKRTEWMAIKLLFGNANIKRIGQIYFKQYITKSSLDQLNLFQILSVIIPMISKQEDKDLRIFQLLLIIFQNNFGGNVSRKLLNKLIQTNVIKPELNQFLATLFLIFRLIHKSNQYLKDFLFSNLDRIIVNNCYDFDLIKIFWNNVDYKFLLKLLYIQYSLQPIETKKFQQIFQQCENLYNQDNQLYEKWYELQKITQNFKLSPFYLSQYRQYQQLPNYAEISLQDFNISLSEMTKDDKKKILKCWIEKMNDCQTFKQLIPFFFNIIKRGEDQKQFVQLVNQELKQSKDQYFKKGFNMKALFQIFFNNSNYELKVILLKFKCKQNPVPLLFQNLNFQDIKEQQEIYILNEKLYYIFPQCLPIISFSLSQNQDPIGKTTLINQIFYQIEKFETSDMCDINRNTIDIMFDYCFSDSRKISVADVHGFIPLPILSKILPLFKIWIVQLNTENELITTYTQIKELVKFYQKQKLPRICFVIRNSILTLDQIKLNLDYSEIFCFTQFVHCILDLTKKNLSKTEQESEIYRFQGFIYGIIQQVQNSGSHYVNQQDFLEIIKNFNFSNETLYQQIENDGEILQKLEQELKKQIDQPNGFYNCHSFPIRSIERQIKIHKREILQVIQSKNPQKNDQVTEINQKITSLENQIKQQKPTYLLSLFCSIFQQTNSYILYLTFTEKLRNFNESNTYEIQDSIQNLNEEIQQLKQERNGLKNNNEMVSDSVLFKKEDIKKQICLKNENLTKYLQNMSLKNIGIELFWRELIQINQRSIMSHLPINPVDIVYDMIKKGEPFEFLDGDQLKIDQKFLMQLTNKFTQSGEEKVLVLSILGPQSSGKSTILNQIFGCHFWTSVGRCTKGIYLQLLKIQQKQYFDDLFDYILILDSEGLQNPNQQDQEFDKKIALFILAISDIILINVKGDIHQQFKNLVEMCVFTLGQMKNTISSIKSLSWCFNQNGDVNNFSPFLHQIQGIANCLNQEFNQIDNDSDNACIDYNEILDIKKENIKILGFASAEKRWKNSSEGLLCNWRQIIINETFSEEAYEYGVRIIQNFVQKKKQSGVKNMSSLHSFIQNIDNYWQSICRLPDLLEFTELLQYKQDELMKKQFEIIYLKQPFDSIQSVATDIHNYLKKIKNKNMQLFQNLQKQKEKEIQQKLEQIKDNVQCQLIQFKQEKQISKKILVKYENRLTERIQTECEENKLNIFNEIKCQETQFQQFYGFQQIENVISSISENSEELQQLQNDQTLIQSRFQNLWNEITTTQYKQMELIFQEFSEKQYKSISSSFTNFKLQSDREQEYQKYFIEHINKKSPFENIDGEKTDIMKIFEPEFKEVQFMILDGTKSINIYGDIFGSSILDRLSKATDNDIINFNSYFLFKLEFYYVTRQDLQQYLEKGIIEDFNGLLNQLKSQKEKLNYKHWQSQIKQFLNIIFFFPVKHDQELWQKLHESIDKPPIYFKQIRSTYDSNIFQAFSQFTEKLQVKDEKSELNNLEFLQYCQNNYQKLQISSYQINVSNQKTLNESLLDQQKTFLSIFYQYQIVPLEENNQSFLYIANKETDSKQFFIKNFQEYFSNEMLTKNHWRKLYSELYDLIIGLMRISRPQQNTDQLQEDDICSSNIDLITFIMSKIKEKIFVFNKQFAKFGIILNLIGDRCIYYFSMFLIWRFSCHKKWKTLDEGYNQLQKLYPKQLVKFYAEIKQNKKELSQLKAKIFADVLYKTYILNFYRQNQKKIIDIIEQKNRSCFDIIREFDEKLLEKYTENSLVSSEQVISYITDQKQYIENNANEEIIKIQEEILQNNQEQFIDGLSIFLKCILGNIKIISNSIAHQQKGVKTSEYFERSENDSKKEVEFDQSLFQLVKSCIFGEKKQNQLLSQLKPIYLEDIFKPEQFTEIPVKFKIEMQSKDEEIQLLQPYISVLSNELNDLLGNCRYEKLNIALFQIQNNLDKIKLNMIGCLVSCPLCKRKCDLPNDNHIKHQCRNGHQLRGMNFVLTRKNEPSLFMCEEITDDMLITTQETSQVRRWKQIKAMHSDWDFHAVDNDYDLTKVKMKMTNVWDKGIGLLICKQLEQKFQCEIKFVTKQEFENRNLELESNHYIFMLDDSFSMEGLRWSNARHGALKCLQELDYDPGAKISFIIFNSNARVVIDCEKVDFQNQCNLIEFHGGGTSFERAFLQTLKQIQNHMPQNFDKYIILFYTDGGDSYPVKAMLQFKLLPLNIRRKIFFFVCSEEDKPSTLSMMVDQLIQNQCSAELQAKIKLGNVEKLWSEIVLKGMHVKE